MDAQTAWSQINNQVLLSLPVTMRHDWGQSTCESVKDGCLTLRTRRTMDTHTIWNWKDRILQEAKRLKLDIAQVVIEGPIVKVIDLSAHQTTPEIVDTSESDEIERLRREVADLKQRLAVTEQRMKSYRSLAAGEDSGVEGVNLAFLLPCLPDMPYLQAKAILTLLALGGSVKMKAVDFARLMGKEGSTASYKRLFAGVEGVVVFDGKNLRIAQVPIIKLANSASSEAETEPDEIDNLHSAQENETENLRNSQETPSKLAKNASSVPSYDDDYIYQTIPIEDISSSRQKTIRNEVLTYARLKLGFNVKYPPSNLDRHTARNAMALVLQALHAQNVKRTRSGLWKTMIDNEQPADQRWLDEAYQYILTVLEQAS